MSRRAELLTSDMVLTCRKYRDPLAVHTHTEKVQ